MATTTIRVDTDTHAVLLELAAETGASLMDTTRAAAEALKRQRFAQHVTEELNTLRADPGAWAEYLADAERTSVPDGIA
ncbi:MAG TPA: hypothetical protein VMM60_12310 [Ilumatobacter sp.]|nr:hypothetical protein [Ilumatobacter sp.]